MDKDCTQETKTWMAKLFEYLTPLLYGNGGAIILVQVENEYGSVGNDKVYLAQARDILLGHVGTKALLYTTDGPWESYFGKGAINGTLTTVDFGVTSRDDVDKIFKGLHEFIGHGPMMNSEFYTGWFTSWGASSMSRTDTNDVINTLHYILEKNNSVNFYMFSGGTNFEFSSGSYNENTQFAPVVTSYDFDSPLNEAADPTPKYYAICEALKSYNKDVNKISFPQPSSKGNYGKVPMKACVSLLSEDGRTRLGKQHTSKCGAALPTFEQLRQSAGLVLYETTLTDADGTLTITEPRDRIYVLVDKHYQGIIDRMKKIYNLELKSKPGSTLSLLVENQGRSSRGDLDKFREFKGILSSVIYKNKTMDGKWSIAGFPLQTVNISCSSVPDGLNLKQGPVMFVGNVTLPTGQEPMDTYLDPTGWTKGYVWVNGHNLGRYWPALGPQVTLYVPGVWLLAPPAHNTLQVLELEHAPDQLTMEFIDHPILH